jgi:hypothetical protein
VLVALAIAPAGLAAACTGTPAAGPTATGPISSAPPPDPLADHLTAERRLLGSYQATIARYPALAKRLAPLRDDHRAHVTALEQALGLAPTATPTASASPTPQVTDIPPVPAAAAAALVALRNAEHAAAAERAAACLTATDTAAPLLASIAACESSHEALLS